MHIAFQNKKLDFLNLQFSFMMLLPGITATLKLEWHWNYAVLVNYGQFVATLQPNLTYFVKTTALPACTLELYIKSIPYNIFWIIWSFWGDIVLHMSYVRLTHTHRIVVFPWFINFGMIWRNILALPLFPAIYYTFNCNWHLLWSHQCCNFDNAKYRLNGGILQRPSMPYLSTS